MWDHVSSGDPELLLSSLYVPVSTKHDHRHCMSLDLFTHVRQFSFFHVSECQHNTYWCSRNPLAVHAVPLHEPAAGEGPCFSKE